MRKPGVRRKHTLLMKLSTRMQHPTVVTGRVLRGRKLKNQWITPVIAD